MVGAEWQVGQLVQNTSHAVTQLASSAFYAGYSLKSLLGLKCGMWSMNIIIACATCSMNNIKILF